VEMGSFFWTLFLEAVIFGHLDRPDRFRSVFDALQKRAPWFLPAFRDQRAAFTLPSDFIANCVGGINKGCATAGIDWSID
ncbi:MAG: hypothetical protein AAF914_10060, partial [Pseudomonadota bacterium]